MRSHHLSLILFSLIMASLRAADPSPPPSPTPTPAPIVFAPEVLPGNGLLQHDFFYAGEQKKQEMFIVKKGQVVWSYKQEETGKGEISDASLLPNGNVLFAHQFGVTLIDSDKKVIWNYDAPPKYEIHTAQAVGLHRVLFIENGLLPKLILVNIDSGKTERAWPLTAGNPNSTHGQFRHFRLTEAGTILIAHLDADKVSEYDVDGKEIWTIAIPHPWSAARLKNGNTLIVSTKNIVREVNPKGETVWELTPADLPGYVVEGFQLATRLPSGNTLINSWANVWNTTIDPAHAPVQAWEITPDKKIVWALRSWTDPADLGPSTTIQLLDDPTPVIGHFGAIH